jgi:hypothetical protein
MNEINFYETLSQDLYYAKCQIQDIVSNEEILYVNQKITRIQQLISIQIQELKTIESG